MKYQVTQGIFENTVFNGFVQSNRVINLDTTGQSYPTENVIYLPEISKIEIFSHNFFKNLNLGDTVNVVKTDCNNTTVTINKGKKEFIISNYLIDTMIQQHKNNN